MLYVEPVYTLREGSGTYPILQFVVVSLGGGGSGSADEGNQVGIGTSFDCALADALGLGTLNCTGTVTPPPPTGGGGQEPPPTGNETQQQELTRLLGEAADDLAQADQALRNGDLAEYQRLNNEAADAIEQAQRIQDQINNGASSGGPTTGSPSSGGATTSSGGG